MARSKQIRKITIATAVVLLPYVTYADFAVKGMGMQFAHLGPTHDRKQVLGPDALLKLSWVQGFISAENQRLSTSATKIRSSPSTSQKD